MRRFAAIATLVVVGVAAWVTVAGPEDTALRPDDQVVAAGAALVPFDACEDLTGWAAEIALERVGPYGLAGLGAHGYGAVDDVAVAEEADAGAATRPAGGDAAEPVPAPADQSGTGQSGPQVSTTNVQEAGIDEPDIVKTDGRILASVSDGAVEILDVSEGVERIATHRLDATQIGSEPELLLAGDRLLVSWTSHPGPRPYGDMPATEREGDGVPRSDDPDADDLHPIHVHSPTTHLELVDLSDPRDPRAVARYRIDGAYLSARMTGGTVRVAVSSTPTGLDLRAPTRGGLEAERAAEQHNREAIRRATADDWLPFAIHEDLRGATVTSEGTAVDCRRVHRPPQPSGLATTTVLTFAMDDGDLQPEDTTAVFAPADTVYASADRLYVALSTMPFAMPVDGPASDAVEPDAVEPDDVTTTLHAFDTAEPTSTRYVASGEVAGHILDQWSLSEHDGHLRVAVTEGQAWGGDTSESAVVVLEERGDLLVETGRVGGLGKGERIYAVRFMGDIGYVVTFRQVDPLYTIDLTDPADPVVRGELKILGYSAYLHPTEPGRLLGVGQDATEEGRILGTQVALFDVADLDAPERLAKLTVEGANSEAEADHRAFLWWEPRSLAFIPMAVHGPMVVPEGEPPRPGAEAFTGLVAYEVGDARFDEAGRVSHADQVNDPWTAQIRRAIVVGDRLLTVSRAGVQATALDGFDTVGWQRF